MRNAQRPNNVKLLTLPIVASAAARATILGGCASRSTAAGGAPGSSTATTGTPSSAAPTSLAASNTPSPTASHAAACTPSDVTISLGHAGAAGGHLGAVLLFTNHGPLTCEISGYPQVTAAGGLTVKVQRTPHGYLGGLTSPSASPPRVELASGQNASAMVEGSDSPVPATATCPAAAGSLNLWLPGYANPSAPTEIPNPAGTCSAIEIHPVVSGATGRQGS